MFASTSRARGRIAAVLVGLAACVAAPAWAQAFVTHMKIDGLPGDSVMRGHENEIVLSAYSQTFGTRNCSRVVASKLIDRASPGLISRAAANTVIPQVIITLTKAGERPFDFFRATLDQVTIERVELGEQSDQLVERSVLAPRSIRIEYRLQNADGTLGTSIVAAFACV